MSAASEQARAFAAAWRQNPQNSDAIYSLMRMQGPDEAREVVEYQVSATLLDQLADEIEQSEEQAALIVPSAELKMLREALSRAQSGHLTPEDSDRINDLVAEIDRHRPLGLDGKHDDLHTPTCGCEDR